MIASLNYNRPIGLSKTETNTNNDSLVSRLKKGDRSSQAECYNLYVGKMYTVALRYTSSREDAKEIINTAFLKVFHSVKSYS